MFRMIDQSLTIIDYKTSRHNTNQQYLLDGYEIQLNGYAFIANELKMGPVKQLALVYMEPLTEENMIEEVKPVIHCSGFLMHFRAKIVPVNLNPYKIIPDLLSRAQQVLESTIPPNKNPMCKNCAAVDSLAKLVQQNIN